MQSINVKHLRVIGLALAGLIVTNQALGLIELNDAIKNAVAMAIVLLLPFWLPGTMMMRLHCTGIEPHQPQKTGVSFNCLHEDCFALALTYLDAKSLAKVQRVDRRSRKIVSTLPGLWNRLSTDDFCTVNLDISPSRGAYIGYLKLVLQRLEDELANATAVDRFAQGLCAYTSKRSDHGIIAMVCDLAIFDDRAMALAVSLKRQCALTTVLVKNAKVVMDFRAQGTVRGPMAFLPLTACENAPDTVQLITPKLASGDTPSGFIGFAVDLIRLKEEHEHLRASVLKATVFKDLQVWASEDNMLQFMRQAPTQARLHYVALDTYDSQSPITSMGAYPLNLPPPTAATATVEGQTAVQSAQLQAHEDLVSEAVDHKKLICLSHGEFRRPCHELGSNDSNSNISSSSKAPSDLQSLWSARSFFSPSRSWSTADARAARDCAAESLVAASAGLVGSW
jgi:hypothetical protein